MNNPSSYPDLRAGEWHPEGADSPFGNTFNCTCCAAFKPPFGVGFQNPEYSAGKARYLARRPVDTRGGEVLRLAIYSGRTEGCAAEVLRLIGGSRAVSLNRERSRRGFVGRLTGEMSR